MSPGALRDADPLPPWDGVVAVLAPWLPARRWFPAGCDPRSLRPARVLELAPSAPGPGPRCLVVLARPSDGPFLIQLTLALYEAADGEAAADGAARGVPAGAAEDGEAGWIGCLPDGSRVREGTADPLFLAAWLAAAAPDLAAGLDPAAARPIAGEQSNSSVVVPVRPGAEGAGAVLKVFRTVVPGPNPDVEVPRALHRLGWRGTPRPLGALPAGGEEPEGWATGSLGVVSQFVPDAEDGFELACRMARAGLPFDAVAGELGAVLADLHRHLARAFPDQVRPGPDAREVRAELAARLAWAQARVPELAARREPLARAIDRVAGITDMPALQRIHGDFHLGQTLRSSRHGWLVLDFEGEPLRSAETRSAPGHALRDVAGLLRSVDYAAAVGRAPTGWRPGADAAIRAAYRAGAGGTHPEILLRAFELDKALYETVYEKVNRPDWLPIPLAAVDRLAACLDREG